MDQEVRVVPLRYDPDAEKKVIEAVKQLRKQIAKKGRIVMGVNEYRIEEQINVKPLKHDPKAEKKVVSSLKSFKKERRGLGVKKALEGVKRAAEKNENLVPPIFEAVKQYATVGQISNVLRGVMGNMLEERAIFERGDGRWRERQGF
jgi:methylmalonyl-CoA mutase N-terminal domain/subunit